MTNPMLQTNDTTTSPVTVTVLLVAIEMSLKTWRLVMGAQNQARRRVKTVEGGNYAALRKEKNRQAEDRIQNPGLDAPEVRTIRPM